jgi:ribosomal peptide maturation radical SAM protein 1
MPLSSADYPSLALGLLKAALRQGGMGCDVRYFSLDYIEWVGLDAFVCLTDLAYYTALLGEWVFARVLHPAADDAGADAVYLMEALRPACPEGELVARMLTILACRESAELFIERCVESVDWDRYKVLGVTTSFQQNMASLALAKRVKARHPHIHIVFGGANCQGEMGLELHRRYPFVDSVCLGEGDLTFPELVSRHCGGQAVQGLPGIVVRGSKDESLPPDDEGSALVDLDRLPYADLSDFYEQRQVRPNISLFKPVTVFETARGCWWGAKHHCTFCGLNGRQMAYRSKSPARVYEELTELVAKHGSVVVTTDAILDMAYFETLLPRLAAEGPKILIYWQMKANLRSDQLALLARAGVKRIQPGIEALDTSLLTLMKKGCTMLQNVQTLKLAAENGISVMWNLLYGFPGEDPAAYERSAALIPKLRHLQPPSGTCRVLADRFSPYFSRPESFGVALEPAPGYQAIYPFEAASIKRLAYHFHMHADHLAQAQEIAAPMAVEERLWNEHYRNSALFWVEHGEGVSVVDERWGWPQTSHFLYGAEADLLRHCGQITPRSKIAAALTPIYGDAGMKGAFDRLLDLGLLLCEGEGVLALPLRQPGFRRAPTFHEIQLDVPVAANSDETRRCDSEAV